MSSSQASPSRLTVFNVPNYLTALRLLLAIVVFVLIAWAQQVFDRVSLPSLTPGPEAEIEKMRWLYGAATVVFLLAAATDWIDGYWARRYGQVTQVGRIFDPFVDKVIICGTYIFLVASEGSEVAAWMAVVVMGRELLVTALRSQVEGSGGDFSAKWAGKVKMVVQCAAIAGSLGVLSMYSAGAIPPALRATLIALQWASVLITIYSGAGYVVAAAKLLRR